MLFRNSPWSARSSDARNATSDETTRDNSIGEDTEVARLQNELDELRSDSESRLQELASELEKVREECDTARDMLKNTEALLMETVEALSHSRAESAVKDQSIAELRAQVEALGQEIELISVELQANKEAEEKALLAARGRHFKARESA